MRKFYRAHDRDPFDVLPITYHIRHGTNDPEFKKFTSYFQQLENQKNEALKEEKELNKKLKTFSDEIKQLQDQITKLEKSQREPESPSHGEANAHTSHRKKKRNKDQNADHAKEKEDVDKGNHDKNVTAEKHQSS